MSTILGLAVSVCLLGMGVFILAVAWALIEAIRDRRNGR